MPPLEAKTSASDWLIWQLADSAFPAGGFAHSGGVEATRQQHELRGRDHLIEFLEAALAQAGRSSLPFVSVAFDAANDFAWTDHLCDAFTTNHVTNRASRLQGHAFLASCERAFCRDAITALRTEVDGQELPGHFAPVFGAICHALHLERGAALRLFLFNQLRSWLSSAVRLGIVGPIDAQTIQMRVSPLAEDTVGKCENYTLEDVAQTAPLIDLFQGTQDRLYSRLFQS